MCDSQWYVNCCSGTKLVLACLGAPWVSFLLKKRPYEREPPMVGTGHYFTQGVESHRSGQLMITRHTLSGLCAPCPNSNRNSISLNGNHQLLKSVDQTWLLAIWPHYFEVKARCILSPHFAAYPLISLLSIQCY